MPQKTSFLHPYIRTLGLPKHRRSLSSTNKLRVSGSCLTFRIPQAPRSYVKLEDMSNPIYTEHTLSFYNPYRALWPFCVNNPYKLLKVTPSQFFLGPGPQTHVYSYTPFYKSHISHPEPHSLFCESLYDIHTAPCKSFINPCVFS